MANGGVLIDMNFSPSSNICSESPVLEGSLSNQLITIPSYRDTFESVILSYNSLDKSQVGQLAIVGFQGPSPNPVLFCSLA